MAGCCGEYRKNRFFGLGFSTLIIGILVLGTERVKYHLEKVPFKINSQKIIFDLATFKRTMNRCEKSLKSMLGALPLHISHHFMTLIYCQAAMNHMALIIYLVLYVESLQLLVEQSEVKLSVTKN